jgi:hypothetical protein
MVLHKSVTQDTYLHRWKRVGDEESYHFLDIRITAI